MRLKTRVKNLETALGDDNPFPAFYRFKETGVLPTYEPDLEKVELLMAMFMAMYGSDAIILTEEILGFTPTKRAMEWARADLERPSEKGSLLEERGVTPKEYADVVFSVLETGAAKEWPPHLCSNYQREGTSNHAKGV